MESIYNKFTAKYFYLPISIFFENKETFINTEGSIKKTNKLISIKKTKNSWQILRKILILLKKTVVFLKNENNKIIFFESKTAINFKNFLNFQYYATQSLVHVNYYLNTVNKPFLLIYHTHKFKTFKLINTKLKYWLDDFFSGGKDSYSQNSVMLANSSKILRSEYANCF